MRSILVIHDAGDRVFVEGRLTKPLPALGFEGWQSSLDLEAAGGQPALDAAMKTSAAILAVVSPATSIQTFCERVAQARAAEHGHRGAHRGVPAKPGDEVWSTLAAVTAGVQDDELWRDLAALLPPPPAQRERAGPPRCRRRSDSLGR